MNHTKIRTEKWVELKRILYQLKEFEGINPEDALLLAKNLRQESIPLSIYKNTTLGIMESTIKYLKEDIGYNFSEIAKLLNRDQRTVWVAYRNAQLKHPNRLAIQDTKHFIPISILAENDKGALRAIIIYLKDKYSLRFSEIGRILNRNPAVICTIYHRKIEK